MSPSPSIERFFEFSLLGLVACAFCALADTGRLDRPSLVFLLAGLLWRGLMAAGLVRLRIPQNAIAVIATAYIIFYPFDFYFISHDFFSATAHGVCFLGVARILSARSNRDYLYTGSLAFVALMGAAALSTQIRFLGWLLAAIVFGMSALTSAEIRRGMQRNGRAVSQAGARTGWRLGLLVGGATCGIVALTAGLFLILPRTARAAAMLMPGGPRLSGFTNSIDLGGFGLLAKDDRPVLHIRSYGASLPADLKWRGAGLSQFDGRRWSEPPFRGQISSSAGRVPVADLPQLARRDGDRMWYRVDTASSDTGTLFIAGVPEFINIVQSGLSPNGADSPRLVRNSEDAFRALPGMGGPLGYEVSAQDGAPLPNFLSNADRRRYLDLPSGLDPRIPELARAWSRESVDGSDLDRAIRIQEHLHRDFVYSLNVAVRPSRDPLANFLFVTRRGYCEYFASAMAAMLRTQKIPARVVTGFQSGYYNDVSGVWVMRASDAHAWVEGWIEGRGWVTFDPTPPGAAPMAGGWWQRINMYLDAADTAWQQWVVAYNPGQQASLAFAFRNKLPSLGRGRSDLRWSALVPGYRGALGFSSAVLAVLLGAFGPRLWRRWRARERMQKFRRGEGAASDAAMLYERMLESMARRGFQKPPWFTPTEFARHLPSGEREAVAIFTAAYNEVRFGGNPSGASRLVEMLEGIETGRATG